MSFCCAVWCSRRADKVGYIDYCAKPVEYRYLMLVTCIPRAKAALQTAEPGFEVRIVKIHKSFSSNITYESISAYHKYFAYR